VLRQLALLAFAVLGAAALVPAGAARAQCAESSPAEGVVLRECTGGGLRWAEVTADLSAIDVGVRATRPEERGQAVSDWAGSLMGALVAVQGGPFLFPSYAPAGLTVGDGTQWEEGRDDARLSVVAFDARGAALIPPADQVVPYEPWMEDVVSGVPVLRGGTVLSPCTADGCEPMPRTAIGLGDDGRTLVLVVVEGWTMDSAGVTDPELGQKALDAGAQHALRTAEGATSLLWSGGSIVIQSSDGSPRPSGAFLAIVDRAMSETARLAGVVEASDTMMALQMAHTRIETIDRRFVDERTMTMTTRGYFEYILPVRDYFVIVSHPGYVTSCKFCPLTMYDERRERWCSAFLLPGTGEETCNAPALGVDAGPWPTGSVDAGPPDAGPGRDAGRAPPIDPGCSAGAAGSSSDLPSAAALLGFALALVARRKVLTVP
jgi:hypothetical protein